MKCIVMTTAANASGGVRQALYLAQGLHRRGMLLAFLTPAQSPLRDMAPLLPWEDLPEGLFALNRRLLDLVSPLFGAEAVVVHGFHNSCVKKLALLGTWWKIRGYPIACAAHRGVIFPPKNPIPYILPGIDGFLVNSRACADTLPLLWRKNRAHVVFNCIPEERLTVTRDREDVRRSLKLPAGVPVIGSVANNNPNKGIQVLLEAFALLGEEQDTRLVLVGLNGELWAARAAVLGVERRVHIIPPTEHVANYLQTMDIFTVPSFSESQPNTLLEAMSMGLAAVGSRVGGIPELITKDDLLAKPGNAQALAAALGLLLRDPDRRRREAEHNKAKSTLFAPGAKLERTLELYASFFPPAGRNP